MRCGEKMMTGEQEDGAKERKGKLGAYAMKRVAAGADLPIPWFCEPAKRRDDRADYCPGCSFLPRSKHQVHGFTVEWTGARHMVEHSVGPMSILGHRAMPINFLA